MEYIDCVDVMIKIPSLNPKSAFRNLFLEIVPMKTGFFQFNVTFGEKNKNLEKVMETLSPEEFDLMVLPELFATGCLFGSRREVREWAKPVPEGPTTKSLMELSAKKGAYIVGSLIERDGENFFNTAVLVGPQGYAGKQRKISMPAFEAGFFHSGSGFQVFEINGVKMGIMICLDLWTSEAVADLKGKGARVILHPANFCGEDSLEMVGKQARENEVFIISANRIGMDKDAGTNVKFIGCSRIVTPAGKVLYGADRREAIMIRQIDFR